jgi:hypothetical protein
MVAFWLDPRARETGLPDVIEGGVFEVVTVRVNVAGELTAPQASVAVTVTVCEPMGPAFVTLTAPVAGVPVSVPVNVGEVAVSVAMPPLSLGGTLGLTVVAPPGTTLCAG